jgi:AbrB family looped-hinge helix DNA binding protein
MHTRLSPVSSKGQVTIPVEIRKMLGISKDGSVAFVVHDDGHIELRSPVCILDNVFGSVPSLPDETPDLEQEIEEAISQHVKARYS